MAKVLGGCFWGAVRYEVDAIDIATCSLDEPERFPPTRHSWLAHDLSWVKFGDGLPAFAECRPAPNG